MAINRDRNKQTTASSKVVRPGDGGIGYFKGRGKLAGHFGPHKRSFKGRAGREEWLVGILWNGFVAGVIGAMFPKIGPLLALPYVIATLAVTGRRLHDLRMSGWMQLVPMAFAASFFTVIGVSGIEDGRYPDLSKTYWDEIANVAGGAMVLAYVVFYGWLGCVPGTQGPNRYGEADGGVQASATV